MGCVRNRPEGVGDLRGAVNDKEAPTTDASMLLAEKARTQSPGLSHMRAEALPRGRGSLYEATMVNDRRPSIRP
jgi:hypothetical protein